MTTKSLEHEIGSAVERLVREHLAECEAAAATAVRDAFARAAKPASKRRGSTAPARRRSPSRRRTRDEIAQLEERLYDAIVRSTALAPTAMGSWAPETGRRPPSPCRSRG